MSEPTTEQRTYPAGVTCWIDLEVDDLDAAQQFYGSLFDWKFTTATPPGVPPYLIAQLDGDDAAGLGGPPPQRDRALNRWNTYVAVDDLEETLASVEGVGGSVVDPVEQAGEGDARPPG